MPLALPMADWVLSLEAGEHIPSSGEQMYVRNLHAHNCRGVILSWAALRQGGNHHINNHGNAYVIELFTELGYRHMHSLSHSLRFDLNRSVPGFHRFTMLRSTLMAFERHTPIDAPGCTKD